MRAGRARSETLAGPFRNFRLSEALSKPSPRVLEQVSRIRARQQRERNADRSAFPKTNPPADSLRHHQHVRIVRIGLAGLDVLLRDDVRLRQTVLDPLEDLQQDAVVIVSRDPLEPRLEEVRLVL